MNLRAFSNFAALILGCGLAVAQGTAQAISVGELADFTGGNNGWTHGLGNWQTLSNGQDGPTDDYLFIEANGGGGQLSRMVTLNISTEWTGDFTAAGVTTLAVDVLNENGQSLDIRFAVDGDGGRFATNSISVPPSSQWQPLSISFDPSNFQSAGGSDIEMTLTSVVEIRLLHNPNPDWRGAAINANLGVDNIEAIGASFDPADFNEDALVDGTDLGIWQTAYGSTDGGDANSDSVTDGADFLIWQQNFAPGIPAIQAVPEPSCVTLLSLAGCALIFLRRKP